MRGTFCPALHTKTDDRNGELLLDDLAKPTGGRVYPVGTIGDLPAIGERISTALRNEYMLGYHPANKARDGKYRYVTLRMSTSSAKIRLHYRQGYYALSE